MKIKLKNDQPSLSYLFFLESTNYEELQEKIKKKDSEQSGVSQKGLEQLEKHKDSIENLFKLKNNLQKLESQNHSQIKHEFDALLEKISTLTQEIFPTIATKAMLELLTQYKNRYEKSFVTDCLPIYLGLLYNCIFLNEDIKKARFLSLFNKENFQCMGGLNNRINMLLDNDSEYTRVNNSLTIETSKKYPNYGKYLQYQIHIRGFVEKYILGNKNLKDPHAIMIANPSLGPEYSSHILELCKLAIKNNFFSALFKKQIEELVDVVKNSSDDNYYQKINNGEFYKSIALFLEERKIKFDNIKTSCSQIILKELSIDPESGGNNWEFIKNKILDNQKLCVERILNRIEREIIQSDNSGFQNIKLYDEQAKLLSELYSSFLQNEPDTYIDDFIKKYVSILDFSDGKTKLNKDIYDKIDNEVAKDFINEKLSLIKIIENNGKYELQKANNPNNYVEEGIYLEKMLFAKTKEQNLSGYELIKVVHEKNDKDSINKILKNERYVSELMKIMNSSDFYEHFFSKINKIENNCSEELLRSMVNFLIYYNDDSKPMNPKYLLKLIEDHKSLISDYALKYSIKKLLEKNPQDLLSVALSLENSLRFFFKEIAVLDIDFAINNFLEASFVLNNKTEFLNYIHQNLAKQKSISPKSTQTIINFIANKYIIESISEKDHLTIILDLLDNLYCEETDPKNACGLKIASQLAEIATSDENFFDEKIHKQILSSSILKDRDNFKEFGKVFINNLFFRSWTKNCGHIFLDVTNTRYDLTKKVLEIYCSDSFNIKNKPTPIASQIKSIRNFIGQDMVRIILDPDIIKYKNGIELLEFLIDSKNIPHELCNFEDQKELTAFNTLIRNKDLSGELRLKIAGKLLPTSLNYIITKKDYTEVEKKSLISSIKSTIDDALFEELSFADKIKNFLYCQPTLLPTDSIYNQNIEIDGLECKIKDVFEKFSNEERGNRPKNLIKLHPKAPQQRQIRSEHNTNLH